METFDFSDYEPEVAQGLNELKFLDNDALNAASRRSQLMSAGFEFSLLSPGEIGAKYYPNRQQPAPGIHVYSEEPIVLQEVVVYGNHRYKEFDDFVFHVFFGKDGALLLKQYRDCLLNSNELVIFIEQDDATNIRTVMLVKAGTDMSRIKLPLAEMLYFLKEKKIEISSEALSGLINGALTERNSFMDWLYYCARFSSILTTEIIIGPVEVLTDAFSRFFGSLIIDEKYWNHQNEDYSPLFLPDDLSAKKLQIQINPYLDKITSGTKENLELLNKIVPKVIFDLISKPVYKALSAVETVKGIVTDELLDIAGSGFQMVNAYFCGLLNGIVDFFKGIFDLIALILEAFREAVRVEVDIWYYSNTLMELLENVASALLEFDYTAFVKRLAHESQVTLLKLSQLMLSPNLLIPDVNISKVGYFLGYAAGFIVTIIADVLYTGGVKAVEDITLAVQKFFTDPKAVLSRAFSMAKKGVKEVFDALIELVSEFWNWTKQGGKKFFDEFGKWVDELLVKSGENYSKGDFPKLSDYEASGLLTRKVAQFKDVRYSILAYEKEIIWKRHDETVWLNRANLRNGELEFDFNTFGISGLADQWVNETFEIFGTKIKTVKANWRYNENYPNSESLGHKQFWAVYEETYDAHKAVRSTKFYLKMEEKGYGKIEKVSPQLGDTYVILSKEK